MTKRSLLLFLSFSLLAWLLPFHSAQAQASPVETAKIESLINHIGSLKGAKFVRNGKPYSSQNAVKFLRGKWEAHTSDVKTAEDFITKIAAASGTTGKPYIIQFADGHEEKCGEYLRAQLKK